MKTSLWKEKVEEVIQEYGAGSEALLPSLKTIQEVLGYVPEESIQFLSQKLGIAGADVFSTLTFYEMFTTKKEGKYVIKICNSICCYLKKSPSLIKIIKEELGIEPGQTTEDGLFTLQVVGCLGLCDQAPSMLINDKEYVNLDEEKVRNIIKQLKEEAKK